MKEKIEKAIKWHENAMTSSDFEKQMIEITLQALQAELDRQENKPLTLNELKEMRHYPVWVKIGNNEPFCMILSNVDKYYVRGALPNIKQNSIKFMVDNDLPIFYKHKPTEDTK